ncbi:hypothetical protein H4219_000251 [Mycoemilia scoparia]|uniref:RING-type domain-containing protein n=1 Tax=Mycoemilia scoparia TaxID=417184 RepID=A0A9W8A8S2_9FUNG|nr:hypothetical protein H4219_000251 [Mycoemilia scoparia]
MARVSPLKLGATKDDASLRHVASEHSCDNHQGTVGTKESGGVERTPKETGDDCSHKDAQPEDTHHSCVDITGVRDEGNIPNDKELCQGENPPDTQWPCGSSNNGSSSKGNSSPHHSVSISSLAPSSTPQINSDSQDQAEEAHQSHRPEWSMEWAFGQYSSLSRYQKVLVIINLVLGALQVSSAIIVLSITARQSCDRPLRIFLIVLLARAVIVTPASVYTRLTHHLPGPLGSTRDPWVVKVVNMCDIVGIALFIIANYWFFTSQTCRSTSPALYYVSFVWIVAGYAIISVPLLVCMAFVLTFPLILLGMRVFGIGSKHMVGADAKTIDAIPLVRFRLRSPPGQSPVSSSSLRPTSSRDNAAGQSAKAGTSQGGGMLGTLEHGSETSFADHNGMGVSAISVSTRPRWRLNLSHLFNPFTRIAYRLSRESKKKPPPPATQTPDAEIKDFWSDEAEDTTCPICLSDYEEREILRLLPCSHAFHQDCVDRWLHLNRLCPLCKADIKAPGQSQDASDPT